MSQFRPPSQPGWGQPEPGQQTFPQWQPPQQPFYPQSGQYRPQSLQVPQPQQQWQQLPMTPIQPAPQKPPKKHLSRILLIALAAILLLAASGIAYAQFTSTPPAPTLSPVDQQATATMSGIQTDAAIAGTQEAMAQATAANQTVIPTQPLPSPTPTTPHSDIGLTQQAGNWSVTLNKVYTSTGGAYQSAKSGDLFVVVDVTAVNTSSSPQLLSSGALFIFQDETGQAYVETVAGIGVPPDGTVQPSFKLRGQISYEVAKSLHTFTLQFQDKLGDGSAVTWNISI